MPYAMLRSRPWIQTCMRTLRKRCMLHDLLAVLLLLIFLHLLLGFIFLLLLYRESSERFWHKTLQYQTCYRGLNLWGSEAETVQQSRGGPLAGTCNPERAPSLSLSLSLSQLCWPSCLPSFLPSSPVSGRCPSQPWLLLSACQRQHPCHRFPTYYSPSCLS